MKFHVVVAYNGKNYSGWQKQTNDPSIQKEIEVALSKILNIETTIQGSGRTDAGVHAYNQHFHFEVRNDKIIDPNKLRYSLNCLLPNDIEIKSIEEVSEDFHARFSAKGKRYIYKISSLAKDPFNNDLVWLYPRPFDVEKYKNAMNYFIGNHNFKNFTSKEEDEANFVRNVSKIEVEVKNEEVITTLEGDGFMRYQIRFMIGTAIAVASSDIDIKYLTDKLDSKNDRDISHYKAPGQGLYLDEVFY